MVAPTTAPTDSLSVRGLAVDAWLACYCIFKWKDQNERNGKSRICFKYCEYFSSNVCYLYDYPMATTETGAPPNSLNRYGVAFPTVSAPTTVPIASPRPERNHVAIIFMAGG